MVFPLALELSACSSISGIVGTFLIVEFLGPSWDKASQFLNKPNK